MFPCAKQLSNSFVYTLTCVKDKCHIFNRPNDNNIVFTALFHQRKVGCERRKKQKKREQKQEIKSSFFFYFLFMGSYIQWISGAIPGPFLRGHSVVLSGAWESNLALTHVLKTLIHLSGLKLLCSDLMFFRERGEISKELVLGWKRGPGNTVGGKLTLMVGSVLEDSDQNSIMNYFIIHGAFIQF